jgi:hypothetical protein
MLLLRIVPSDVLLKLTCAEGGHSREQPLGLDAFGSRPGDFRFVHIWVRTKDILLKVW